MPLPTEKLRVLILASECNPEWPSLPVVGYNYAKALSQFCDTVVVTHVRNRPYIERAENSGVRFDFIDTEYIARPLHKLSVFLRGGSEVAWSTGMIMAYLPYLEFERQAWKRYRKDLRAGQFDIVHRITPMSPTLPSFIAGRSPQPFVLGPLNGNLPWPATYRDEQKREKEQLRMLRNLYKFLPYSRSTYREAAMILAAFQHTIDDLDDVDPGKILMFPEVGYDATLFHPPAGPARIPGAPTRFLFAGRLVPYKLPEVAVRAFVGSEQMRGHYLHIVGDGPERPRLEQIVAEHGFQDRVIFEGRRPQAEVAQRMRETDVFVFPSIRELGAGVVVEAMASAMLCLVVDYGAPRDLVASDRGIKLPLAPIDELTASFRAAMERCASDLDSPEIQGMRQTAARHAEEKYEWHRKAEITEQIYRYVLGKRADCPAPF